MILVYIALFLLLTLWLRRGPQCVFVDKYALASSFVLVCSGDSYEN